MCLLLNLNSKLQLAGLYNNVVATGISREQPSFAPKLPNICYEHTPPIMSIPELKYDIGPQGTVDVVTVAQGLHRFDHLTFFKHVNWVLRRPNGMLTVWCYTTLEWMNPLTLSSMVIHR